MYNATEDNFTFEHGEFKYIRVLPEIAIEANIIM